MQHYAFRSKVRMAGEGEECEDGEAPLVIKSRVHPTAAEAGMRPNCSIIERWSNIKLNETCLPSRKRPLALMERPAKLQLLDGFPRQLVKLLRLRGEGPHLVLSELRLKRQNFLQILRLGDFVDQRES
jgi:hypothetical protein